MRRSVPVGADDAADPVAMAVPPDRPADPAIAIMVAGPMSMAAGIVVMMAVAVPAMGVALRGSRLGRQAVHAEGKNGGQGNFHDPHCRFSHYARRDVAGRAPIEAHDGGLAGNSAFSRGNGSGTGGRGAAWLTPS